MRKLVHLQRAEPEPVGRRPGGSWGIHQGLMLVGVVVTLSALVLGIFLLQSRPKPPVFDIPVDSIQKGVQGLSPRQAWRRWRTLRAYGLDRTPLLVIEDHDKALLQWRLGMSVALVLAAGGVALCVIPPLIRARPISGGR